MNLLSKISAAAEFIKNKSKYTPEIGLILGSGLGSLADTIEEAEFFDYADIPNFPTSTVEGHKGRLVIGLLEGKQVIAMQGRFHFYEGYSMQEVTFPVRVMKLLGVSKLVVTNACGAVNTDFNPGDLMVITDHINLSGANPLIGRNLDEFGPRFPDMSEAYNKDLRNKVLEAGKDLGLNLKQGVYVMLSGPTYETPAEIRMVGILGGDTVGMSTVPEVIAARHMELPCFAISIITDLGVKGKIVKISHEDVIKIANKSEKSMTLLMKELLK